MNSIIKNAISHISLKEMIVDKFKTTVTDVIIDQVSKKIIKIAMNECTVSFTFKNHRYNNFPYYSFLKWLSEHLGENQRNMETLVDDNGHNDNMYYDIGDTPVYFFYKKHLFVAQKKYNERTGLTTIEVIMIGRNVSIMAELLAECKKLEPSNVIEPEEGRSYFQIYKYSRVYNEWVDAGRSITRSLNSVIVKKSIKDDLMHKIKDWKESEDWFKDRGIPYKISLLLHGPAGTGKTSFIKAVASELGFSVFMVNLADFNDDSLQEAITNTHQNSVIVFEDFDGSALIEARNEELSSSFGKKKTKKKGKGSYEEDEEDDEDYSYKEGKTGTGVTFSGFLNILDGLCPLDNKIIFFTTNVLKNIDSAILRHGRVDFKYYIGALEQEEVTEYINMMFPDIDSKIIEGKEFSPIVGCEIQAKFFDNKYNPEKFVETLEIGYKEKED